jgi:hypothetical protein
MQTLTRAAALGIREVSGLTGLSMATLRWYEREGLLPLVDRTPESAAIEAQMDQLRADLGVIEDKIEHYQDLIDRELDCEDEIAGRTDG